MIVWKCSAYQVPMPLSAQPSPISPKFSRCDIIDFLPIPLSFHSLQTMRNIHILSISQVAMEDTTTTHDSSAVDFSSSPAPTTTATLPPEALDFAARVYNAARDGNLPLFNQALPAGLPPNMTNEKGDSLVMLASYHGHSALVRLLLSHGADPNRLNDRGQSPLAGAVFKNEEEVVETLLEGGADPELGAPSAMEAAMLFKMEDKWGERFRDAKGRGKADRNKAEPGTSGIGGVKGAQQPL